MLQLIGVGNPAENSQYPSSAGRRPRLDDVGGSQDPLAAHISG